MLHNTAQNSSDNLSSYPPDNHHRSDVYWRGGVSVEREGFADSAATELLSSVATVTREVIRVH